MQPEAKTLLLDIQNAARLIFRFTQGRSFEDYENDPMLRSAVERQFEIVGEALNQLMKIAPAVASQVADHRKIIAFRNILIHGYAVVEDELVWGIVETKLSALLESVEQMLPAEKTE